MMPKDLLIESEDTRSRKILRKSPYEYYSKSLEKYIPWMKEQISKNKDGSIKVRRGDLAIAMKKELTVLMGDKYRDKTFKSLFGIIRVVLFNEGIFTDVGHYNRERIFILRDRTPNDYLIPSLTIIDKNLRNSQ